MGGRGGGPCDRRPVARAIGRAALPAGTPPVPAPAAFAASGPVPRRVAVLLAPAPAVRTWPAAFTAVDLAARGAVVGMFVSARSAVNSVISLFLMPHAATPR